jgi:hypothetical protein
MEGMQGWTNEATRPIHDRSKEVLLFSIAFKLILRYSQPRMQ